MVQGTYTYLASSLALGFADHNLSRFFIAPEDASIGERERLALVKVLTSGTSGVASIVDYFYKKTQELIKEESWTSVGSQGMHTKNVDITRDVLKFVPMYWACEVVRRIFSSFSFCQSHG